MTYLTVRQITLWTGLACVFYFYGLIAQPIYIMGPICIAVALLFTIKNSIRYRPFFIANLFLILLCSIIITIIQIYGNANVGVLWNYSLCLFIYVAIALMGGVLKNNIAIDIIIKVSWTIVLYSLVDGVWRLFHPNPDQIFAGNPFFYRFKDNSLMFEDSNFVGAALVVTYGAIKYIKYQFFIKTKKITLLLYLAMFLTFSRASLISIVALELFVLFLKCNRFVKVVVAVITLFLIMFSVSYLLQDGSFRTKFYIINLFLENYLQLSFEDKLLGVGLGNSFEYLGIGAHSVLVVYGFELGWLGTILQLLILLLMTIISRGKIWFVYFAYYVNGFSLTAIAIPLLFFYAALISCLSCKVENEKNISLNSNL